MNIHKHFIKQVEVQTGLIFKEDAETGNLCYRYNNVDLQDEFKEVFTRDDLYLFIASFGDSPVVLPHDREEFWNAVEKGRQSVM